MTTENDFPEHRTASYVRREGDRAVRGLQKQRIITALAVLARDFRIIQPTIKRCPAFWRWCTGADQEQFYPPPRERRKRHPLPG